MAIKISGTTVIDDSRNLTNVGGIKTVGGQSLLGSGDIDVGGNLVVTPSITSPTNGQTAYNDGYTSSAYSTVDSYNGTHNYSEWQLSTDSGFNTIVDSYSGSSNLTSWSTNADSAAVTTYYVRVRYGSDSHLSEWSDTISYTTPNIYIATPTITYPSNGATDIGDAFDATASAFTVVNGTDTHVSSDWQLATDSGFSNIIYQSMGDTTNLTTNTISIPSAQTLTTYYLRVRYNGTAYGTTAYVSSSFTTSASFSGEVSYTSAGQYNFTVPNGVSSLSMVTIASGGDISPSYAGPSGNPGGGLSYKNNLSVSSGQTLVVVLEQSNSRVELGGNWQCAAERGGSNSSNGYGDASYSGGASTGSCGGWGAGGAAGSYDRDGNGPQSPCADGNNGAGNSGYGGGTGLFGGTGTAAYSGRNGSQGGQNGQPGPGGSGISYGGGRQGYRSGFNGGIRIIWPGDSRTFPNAAS
jgi:hypothetical protein